MSVNYFNKLRKSALVNALFSCVVSNLVLFAQPLQQVIINNNTPKMYLPQGGGYFEAKPIEQISYPLDEQTIKVKDGFKNTRTPHKTTAVYFAAEKLGVIGKTNNFEGENPYDNYFTINLPENIQGYEAYLAYQVYGVKNASQTTKSINGHNAYGGQLIEASDEWKTVKERISVNQLVTGKNEIFFNRREDNTYQYKIKNLRIGLEPAVTPSDIQASILKIGKDYYLSGIVDDKAITNFEVSGHTIPVNDGAFEYVFRDLPTGPQNIELKYFSQNNKIVKVVEVFNSEAKLLYSSENNLKNKSAISSFSKIAVAPVFFDNICISAEEDSVNQITSEINNFIIQPLDFKDIRIANDELKIVTAGEVLAYKIKKISGSDDLPVKVHLKYDNDKIPGGYTAKDIRTFYFDRTQRSWKALPVDSLDIENNEIVSSSLIAGDTDYINGVIKLPDSPETGSFAPTMMADMKYADPSAGVVSIAPPSPNSNGTATTSFPIKLPQGRAGMQPSLNVSYSSEGGNGWMGIGWNLTTPSISINTKWGVPRFDVINESEIYNVNGADLVLWDGSEYTNPHRKANIGRTVERRFYERKEGGYNLIIRHGNNPKNYWWEVTDKMGNKSIYGAIYNSATNQYTLDTNSIIKDDNGNIAHWALKSSIDTQGNYILYDYVSPPSITPFAGSTITAKAFYLNKITYSLWRQMAAAAGQPSTPALSNQSYYEVDFIRNTYQLGGNSSVTRNDVIINGRNGFLQIVNDLLTEIRISYKESGSASKRIRSYKFDYEDKAFKKKQLVAISEYSPNATDPQQYDLFYKNTIEYYDYDTSNTSIISSTGTSYGGNSNTNDVSSTLFDIAGFFINAPNGSPLGTSTASGFSAGLRFGVGFGWNPTSISTTGGGGFSYNQSKQETKISFIDINGDGLPDKVYNSINGVYYKRAAPGTQNYWTDGIPINDISSLSKSKSTTHGKSGEVNIANFGVGISSSKTTTVTDNYFTDFNGDGLPDMVRGNRVQFNKHNGSATDIRHFDNDASNTENPIFSGTIDEDLLESMEFDPITVVHEEYPQFDHVKVWQAPITGSISISGDVILRSLNPINNIPNNFPSNYPNKIIVDVEHWDISNNNDNASSIISFQTLSDNNINIPYQMSTPPSTPVSVEKGDYIFFRIHNYEYGTGAEVEWNPEISYMFFPSTNDENGKPMFSFNAKDDLTMVSAGSVKVDESYDNCHVSFNIPTSIPYLTDDVKFIVKRIGINSSTGDVYTTKYEYTGSNTITIPVSGTSTISYYLQFYVDSDSNIDWSLIDWNPSYYFDSNVAAIEYPSVNYTIYNNNINNTGYTFNNSDLVQPNMGTGNNADFFYKISHNFLETWDNFALNNNSSIDLAQFPVKVSWVTKAETLGGNILLDKSVYYIHFDQNTGYYFSYSEIPNTYVISSNYYNYNNYITINKGLANSIYSSGGRIYSAFYISYDKVGRNNPSQITISLDPYQDSQASYYNFTPKTLTGSPFFAAEPTFYGNSYRGWGQFLYNGGIQLNYNNEGETDGSIQYNYSTSTIEVALFDYDAIVDAQNQNVNNYPTTARYSFYKNDNIINKYTSDVIFNDSETQTYADYGFNSNGELTAKLGRFGESSVFDQFIDPASITDPSNTNSTFVALKQYIRSKGNAQSFEAGYVGQYLTGGANISTSEANSTILNNYVDINGDRYPDVVTKDHIQFTNMQGGLSEQILSSSFAMGDDSFDDTSGINVAGITPNSSSWDNNKIFNKTITNSNSGKNNTQGISKNLRNYIDMNGDGLPDRVFMRNEGIEVQLNTGYSFTESFIWGTNYNVPKVSSRSSNVNEGLSTGTINASFAIGTSASRSNADVDYMLVDVNGDGLPDLIRRNAVSNNYTYYLNTGNEFIANNFNAPNYFAFNNSVDQDTSLTLNLHATYTYGIIIPIPFLTPIKITATGSGAGSATMSEKNITLQDWNGDGLVDLLSKDNNNNNSAVNVKLNTIDKTYLLKKVNTPLGGNWSITYERDGNTYQMPQSKWVLKSITTNDGFSEDNDYKPDTTQTEVAYSEPNYDRRERDFFGYKFVSIQQIDPSTSSPYRTVTKAFHNENYYLSGLESSTVVDGLDGIISESETRYNLLNPDSPTVNMAANEEGSYLQSSLIANAETLLDKSRLFVAPVKVTSTTYEGGAALTTVKEFTKYDNYGNLKEYIDRGENDDDTYKTLLSYWTDIFDYADNALGLPLSIHVYDLNLTKLYRKRVAVFNHFGKLAKVKTYFSSDENDLNVYGFFYDEYGNVNVIRNFDNVNAGSSATYTQNIVYDNKVHTYPITLSNSYGESSSAQYEYLFGTPTLTTDMNGQKMRTKIDTKGRVTEVTGPNEMALEATTGANTAWTIKMEYENSFAQGGTYLTQHHAITRHFDPEYANGTNVSSNELVTVSIVDGFGQPLQVKRTHFSDTVKWLVSGFEKKDAFGRVLESYLPVTQTYTDPYYLLYKHIAPGSLPDTNTPLTMTYDSKDRVRTIVQPGETDGSTIDYEITDGMLVQKVINANDGQNQTLDTYTDIRGRQRKTVQNGTKTIEYTYNLVSELLKVNDENSETSYKYDLGGRTIETRQPDRGLTTFTYDKANRLIEQSNSNLIINNNQKIKYHYNFGRLIRIEYPQNPENEVKYTYGAPGDALAVAEKAVGRLLKQEDATGVQVFGYGRMGEVTKNLRSVAVAGHHSFWFFTQWKYDSWNRVSEIVYPDQEKVTYKYNIGGNVYRVENELPDDREIGQNIVDTITYNDYGERVKIIYGNGTFTTYDYDARRRMNAIQHNFAGNYQVNKNYTFDVLSNIKKIETLQPQSSLPSSGQLGGPVYHEYTYDNFNRLTDATGHYTGPTDIGNNFLRQEYEVHMEYNNDHTIKKKTQIHWQGEVASLNPIGQADKIPVHKTSYVLDYSGYASGDFVAGEYGYVQQHAPRKIVESPGWVSNPAQDDPRIKEKTIEYDANGNLTEIKEKAGKIEVSLRKNLWDEENRLIGVDLKPDDHNNKPVAVYTYDAGGQRTIRYNYDRTDVYSNAKKVGSNTTENIMIYPSGLLMGKVTEVNTLRDIPITYTKHYYIGSERISAKTGSADYLCFYPNMDLAEFMPNLQDTYVRPDSNQSVVAAGTIVTGVFNTFGITQPALNPDYTNENHSGIQLTPHSGNLDIFYFHPDHLGSSSYITNKAGIVCQHMEYLPFGETLADEHLNSINSPFKYNGKELDEETGNYYYGARYYDPKWSIFISVDPLVDKTRDAYGYCYQNPINLVDPTGMSAEGDGFYRDLETNEVKYFAGDGYREGYELLANYESNGSNMAECVVGEPLEGDKVNFAYAYEVGGDEMFEFGHALGIDFETGQGYEIFHPMVDGEIVNGLPYGAWPGGRRASQYYTWQVFEPGTLIPFEGDDPNYPGFNFWNNGGIGGNKRAPLGLQLDFVRVDINKLRKAHSVRMDKYNKENGGHRYIIDGVCSTYVCNLIDYGQGKEYQIGGQLRRPSLGYSRWDPYEKHIKNPFIKP